MYKKELSHAERNSVNVGWLDKEHPFSTGPVNPRAVFELVKKVIEEPKNQMRGFHACNLCDYSGDFPTSIHVECNGKSAILGSAEILIKGKSGSYVTPTFILHYIENHSYQPPEEFVQALMDGIANSDIESEMEGRFVTASWNMSTKRGCTLNESMQLLEARTGLRKGTGRTGVYAWKAWFAENS